MKAYVLLAMMVLLGSACAAAPSLDVGYEVTPSSITPGGTAQVVINVANLEALTAVEKVKITLISQDQGVYVTSGGASLGTISASSTSSAAFGISARDSAKPGTYIIEGRVSYVYNNDESSSFKVSIPVTVTYRSALELFATDIQVTPGATETLQLSLKNSGKGEIKNVIVTLSPSTTSIYPVGNIRRNIGVVAPGESSEIDFDIRASDSASVGIQPVTVTLEYSDAGGSTQTDTQSIGVIVVDPGKELLIKEIVSSLEPGKTGSVEIFVENVGDVELKDLYFSLATTADLKVSGSNERMIESLGVGETKSTIFEFDVSQEAEAKPAESTLSITYQRGAGKKQITDSKIIGIDIEGKVDLRVVDVSVDKADGEMELDIANYGSKDADAIRVDVFSDGTELGTGFTDTIKPNKHKVFRFDVPTTTTVVIKIIYKDYESESGEALMEMTLPIKKEDILGGAGDPTSGIVLLVIVVIVIFWYLRRRRKNKVNIDISKYKNQ